MDKPRLLLFDDEKDTAELTVDTLEEEFQVDWVPSYEDLDKIMKKNRYSVVVTDVIIGTSELTGYEIIDEMRRKYKMTRIPVVVYSAVMDVDEIKRSQGKLFYDYVEKMAQGKQEKLLDVCKRAANQSQHMISWDTLEAYFKKIEKLDEPVSRSNMPDAFILGIHFEDDPTIRMLIAHARNSESDDDVWDVIERLLLVIYKRYNESSST